MAKIPEGNNVMGATKAQQELAVKVVNSPSVQIDNTSFDDALKSIISSTSSLDSYFTDTRKYQNNVEKYLLDIRNAIVKTPIKPVESTDEASKETLSTEDKESKNNVFSNLWNNFKEKRAAKAQLKADLNPKPAALLAASNLESLVATGFILLHNDLTGSGKKDKATKKAAVTSGVGAGALGSLAAGATAGIITGLADAFSNDPTDDHFNSIISELNLQLTADDFAGDPEIRAYQDKGFKDYLQAYYREKSNALIAGVAGDVVASAIAGIGEGLKRLFGKDPGEETNKLKEIADELTASMDISWFLNDPEILDIQKNNFKAYLRTYYITQTTDLALNGAASAVSGAVGTAINSLLSNMFGIKRPIGPLEALVNDLFHKMDREALLNDPEIQRVNTESLAAYLDQYYKLQLFEMQADGYTDALFGTLGSLPGKLVKGFFQGFFGKEESPATSAMNDLVEYISAELPLRISKEDLLNNETITSTYVNSVSKYLSVYYDLQGESLQGDRVKNFANDLGESIGSYAKGIFTGLFGRKKEASEEENSKFVQTILDIDTALSSTYTASNLLEGETGNTLKEGYVANINTVLGKYYDMIFASAQTSMSSLLWNFSLDPEQTSQLKQGSTKLISTVASLASEGFEIDASKIQSTKENAVKSTLTEYFAAAKEELLGSKGKLQKDFTWSQLDKINQAFTDMIAGSISGSNVSYKSNAVDITSSDSKVDTLIAKMDDILSRLTSLTTGVTISNIGDISPSTVVVTAPASNDDLKDD